MRSTSNSRHKKSPYARRVLKVELTLKLVGPRVNHNVRWGHSLEDSKISDHVEHLQALHQHPRLRIPNLLTQCQQLTLNLRTEVW